MIKTFERGKVYSRFKQNIWVADITEMASLFFKNQGVE